MPRDIDTDMQLGTPIRATGTTPIRPDSDEKNTAFGWQLSRDAQRDIQEIEDNARTAQRLSGAILLR